MDMNWYNVKIDGNSKSNELLEKPNKMGKYGKRTELEPLIRRFYKERRETDQLLSPIKYTLSSISLISINILIIYLVPSIYLPLQG